MFRPISVLTIMGLILIVSCSNTTVSSDHDVVPKDPVSLSATTEFLAEQRYTFGITDEPSFQFIMANKGCDDESLILFRDISVTYRESNTETHNYAYNYILIVDMKGIPCATDFDRVKLFRLPKDAEDEEDLEFLESWGAYDTYTPNSFDIHKPLSCLIVTVIAPHKLYAVISDKTPGPAAPLLKLYEIILDNNGNVANIAHLYNISLTSNLTSLAGVQLESSPNVSHRIFGCDFINAEVRVYNAAAQLLATISLSNYIPVGVAVTYESSDFGKVYVAYINPTDRHLDKIHVYTTTDWDNFNDEGQIENTSAQPIDSPFLRSISVHQAREHDDQTVAFLTLNPDTGWGFHLSQYQFNSPANHTEGVFHFTHTTNGFLPYLTEGLAIGVNEVSGGIGSRNSPGYFYFVGDRDPGINATINSVLVYSNG